MSVLVLSNGARSNMYGPVGAELCITTCGTGGGAPSCVMISDVEFILDRLRTEQKSLWSPKIVLLDLEPGPWCWWPLGRSPTSWMRESNGLERSI